MKNPMRESNFMLNVFIGDTLCLPHLGVRQYNKYVKCVRPRRGKLSHDAYCLIRANL